MKLEQTNRIIIKIGSALLFNETSGSLNKEALVNSGAKERLLYTNTTTDIKTESVIISNCFVSVRF